MRDTKGQILRLLRAEGATVSGETLSVALSLSRTAVWKQVRKLQELGYAIEAGPRGYRLDGSSDTPLPWEFPGREETVHYFPEVASTMDIARKLARDGCPPFSVVVADRQTKGRGRLQRSWHSEAGGLYFTVVLRPALPPLMSPRVSFSAALALVLTLRERFDVAATLKWPNDILVGERKLAGMLSEMEAETDRIAYVNVGIGLNLNNDPSGAAPAATTLKAVLGRPVSRTRLLQAYLDALEAQLAAIEDADVMAQWKAHTVTLGRRVDIVTQRETVSGTAVDVDENGSLILQLADGSLKTVIYGDCFHR
ncbi:MAG: biotin--[acetyl-CoA-carboxylase] ligase [Desulfobacteraceae bacterium]|nr:MAG: biotin--[acetyl-CoA-carboxylase] ligase [Desulfobacteraceae bacterium]